jgi:hypothetical protein
VGSFTGTRGDKWLTTCSLFVDYRHFDAAKIVPRFEFGFGLSYTSFEYSGLVITPVLDDSDNDWELEANWLAGKPGPQGVGSSTALWLHRPMYSVSFTVQNTGQVAGTEVRALVLSRLRVCVPETGDRYHSFICTFLRRQASRPPS